MENTTKEKLYVAKLECEELFGFIKVPVDLFKEGSIDISQLSKSASDASGMTEEQIKYDYEVVQSYFTEDEIKELKKYFEDKKDVKLHIKEVSTPVKLEDGNGLILHSYDGDILHGFVNYKDEGRILSYKLNGYYCCYEGLHKDCKKVKVWISTSSDYSREGIPRILQLAQGELTYKEYSSCPPNQCFWIGEIDEESIKEVRIALSAEDIRTRFFRFLKPIDDDHPFVQMRSQQLGKNIEKKELSL